MPTGRHRTTWRMLYSTCWSGSLDWKISSGTNQLTITSQPWMSTHRSGPTGTQYCCREVRNCRNKHRSPTTVRTIWPVLQDSPSASPQGVPAYWVEATTIQQFQDKPTLSAQGSGDDLFYFIFHLIESSFAMLKTAGVCWKVLLTLLIGAHVHPAIYYNKSQQ